MNVLHRVMVAVILIAACVKCTKQKNTMVESQSADTVGNSGTFLDDVNFLKQYSDVIVLEDSSGRGKVAVSAALQGRIMTSTSGGDNGMSYGWINREAFLSGDTSEHMNAYGGEDRIWLGPEGGQFSIYFAKGTEFNLDNWHVPRVIDLDRYDVVTTSRNEAMFKKEAQLTNYSGTVFDIALTRTVQVIEKSDALKQLDIEVPQGVALVAFQSVSELKNVGTQAWKKDTGLLSIWILGMFNPSPGAAILIPYHGSASNLREFVNDTYFGQVPSDRLKLLGKTVFFKADGKYRSKIGLLPENAPEVVGSYDSDNRVITIVKYSKPSNEQSYVNSLWEIQKEPYRGDAVNAYNDGPPAPGAKPLGPFYELETSSPAAELKPGESISHTHATFHFKGSEAELDPILKKFFNVSIAEVRQAL
jgi:hypothetical protein